MADTDILNMSDEEFKNFMNVKIYEGDDGQEEIAVDGIEDTTVDNNLNIDDSNTLEQPATDSDDDIIDYNDENTALDIENSEQTSEENAANDLDVNASTTTEQSSEPANIEAQTTTVAEEEAKIYKFKADGNDYSFTQDEINAQFGTVFAKAANYTRKMQELKDWTKTIDAIKSEKLSHDDVSLLIDALKGNKDAVSAIVKRANVDTLDINVDASESYKPTNYGRSHDELEIVEIEKRLKSSNIEAFNQVHDIVVHSWDEASYNEMVRNPQYIEGLQEDVITGKYAEIAPIMNKIKILDGGRASDIEYYGLASKQYYANISLANRTRNLAAAQDAITQKSRDEANELARVKAETAQRQQANLEANKRQAATPTKVGVGNTSSAMLHDLNSMSDDEFVKFMNKQLNGK